MNRVVPPSMSDTVPSELVLEATTIQNRKFSTGGFDSLTNPFYPETFIASIWSIDSLKFIPVERAWLTQLLSFCPVCNETCHPGKALCSICL